MLLSFRSIGGNLVENFFGILQFIPGNSVNLRTFVSFLDFVQRGSFVMHMRRHSDVRAYQCEHCGKGIKTD